MVMGYNAIIMATPDKLHILSKSYPYMIKNLGPGLKHIKIVANTKCKKMIEDAFATEDRVEFLDEEEILQGLTLSKIKEILKSICGYDYRAGWFYQQFLKMAYSYICEDDYYLLFDSDTIPLHQINYFSKDGKPCFVTKIEYHRPYFDTIDTLFDGEVKRVNPKESFIAENMMISRMFMQEMIEKIMINPHLEGKTFYEKILKSVDRNVVKDTGFSEFETYGNYIMTFHPEAYHKMKLRTQRMGAFLLGDDPDEAQLEWAANDYDIMSFEPFGRRWLTKKTKSEKIRKKYSAKQIFEKYIKFSHLYDLIRYGSYIKYD
ncbi:hypothetical protein SAMN02745247_03014 [Butyrivibrio hungatei DSM 14810]|uniref:Glycosyl transferase family 8 n=2 Tax=Butyrivibrio hungatei TaxID=185008 RepID=A0A1M7T524_9FIRM|nr:hypothetical protein SAMN02745247_03014 [Butyrivibrio hungatei DSM 14810]